MRRALWVLLGLIGLAVVGFVAWALLTPLPPAAEKAPPSAKRPPGPLQADAEGYYVPGYNFSIGYFRFSRITLHPETYLTFSQTTTGTRHEIGCADAGICYPPLVQTATVTLPAGTVIPEDPAKKSWFN